MGKSEHKNVSNNKQKTYFILYCSNMHDVYDSRKYKADIFELTSGRAYSSLVYFNG